MDPIERENEVSVWLESALHQYGKAEPRAGLEGRVLASLQVERTRTVAPSRWWWAAGTAIATTVAIAVALWIGESDHQRNPARTMGASTTTHPAEDRALVQPGPAPQVAHPAREAKQRMPANRPIRDLAAKRMPKLEQFPSRRNLSKEKSLLVRRLNEQSNKEALLDATATRAEIDLSIGSREIRPLQVPDIEISESETN